jgi:tRNA A37 threonylcarbamoyladenosine dehydratase
VLCDPGTVAGGLLVRQNYTENDIGDSKVESLRRRILAIRDDIDVEAHNGLIVNDLAAVLSAAHIIIDATISTAIGKSLDSIAAVTPRPFLAQVATDARTSTLGLLTISAPAAAKGPRAIDQEAGPPEHL